MGKKHSWNTHLKWDSRQQQMVKGQTPGTMRISDAAVTKSKKISSKETEDSNCLNLECWREKYFNRPQKLPQNGISNAFPRKKCATPTQEVLRHQHTSAYIYLFAPWNKKGKEWNERKRAPHTPQCASPPQSRNQPMQTKNAKRAHVNV